MNGEAILLGVNIDHIATLRQARGNDYPCPVAAALLAEQAGADGITAHLREDRRHIQDTDIEKLNARLATRLNLEMAATEEMLAIAQRIKPAACCLVPEKRQELTTEGGLDVLANGGLAAFCGKLASAGIQVSLFIDPDFAQIDAAVQTGAPVVELHTGAYANNANSAQLHKIQLAAKYAKQQGLQVNAGHGLHLDNVAAIAAIAEITELNIGHALIAHAAFVGLPRAVADFKQAMLHRRQ